MSIAKEEAVQRDEVNEDAKLTGAVNQMVAAARVLNQWTGNYTHVFVKPFEWQGERYEQLSFDWENLSGRDCILVETAARRRNAAPTLHANDYPIAYLEELAVRACTERNEKGRHVLGTDAFDAMPAQDCLRICRQARAFLANLAL